MTTTIVAASLLLLQAASGTSPEAQSTEVPEEKSEIEVVDERPEMVEKITDRSHPDYVRCRSEAVIGSRAKRKKTCMTNRKWALASRRGNEESREFLDRNQPGFNRIPGQN